jgi:hypothetical protein
MAKPKTTSRPAKTTPRRGRTWVLDTETKGTGAEMVPLEKALRRAAPRDERVSVIRRDRGRSVPDEAAESSEAGPRRFRVVDVMSRQVLAEDASTRATLDLLKERRSVVDVRVSVWDDQADDWRPLTLREQRVLWDFRDR